MKYMGYILEKYDTLRGVALSGYTFIHEFIC